MTHHAAVIRNIFLFLFLFFSVYFVCFVCFSGIDYLKHQWVAFFRVCADIVQSRYMYFEKPEHIVVFISLFFLVCGICSFSFCIVREQILCKRTHRRCQKKILHCIADNVYLTSDTTMYAYTIGLFRPRVYISLGLKEHVSTDAYAAIIAHEQYHAYSYHPAIRFCAFLFLALFPYIPVLWFVWRIIRLKQEYAADVFAIQRTSKKALADALLSLSMHGKKYTHSSISVAGFAFLKERASFLFFDTKNLYSFVFLCLVSLCSVVVVTVVLFVPLAFPRYVHAYDVMSAVNMDFCEAIHQSRIQTILR